MRLKVDPNSPGIRRKARRYEAKLRDVLALALKGALPRESGLIRLLKTARVEGADSALKSRNATISFRGKPLRGSLHQIYDWSTLDVVANNDLARSVCWSLRHSLREDRKR